MNKYTINKFLELRFEDGKTNIYVANKLFMHCKYILLNISASITEEIAEIDSIDDAVEMLSGIFEFKESQTYKIPPETLFWAHCSNLQAWYENGYNTFLIHSNLAFPLLKELIKVGDPIARKIFKEEVAKRFESKNLNVIQFMLYNGYLNDLNKEELEIVLEHIKNNLFDIVISQLKELMKSMFTHSRKIKNLVDLMLFIDLKYNENLILRILNQLTENMRINFARFLIFHLNYKEFIDYKIPYGKYFMYFENFLDLIYENFPEIKDIIKNIDSGFLNGAISLDEKYSYGSVSYP